MTHTRGQSISISKMKEKYHARMEELRHDPGSGFWEGNDQDLCPACGGVHSQHDFFYEEELKEYRDKGYKVTICDTNEGGQWPKGIMWVNLTPPPDDPCDSDFMEDISS